MCCGFLIAVSILPSPKSQLPQLMSGIKLGEATEARNLNETGVLPQTESNEKFETGDAFTVVGSVIVSEQPLELVAVSFTL